MRDLFRGLIRMALVLCLMVSCVETFYFMGELSKTSHKRYNPNYGSTDYYTRSSTIQEEELEEVKVDDYEQDSIQEYGQQENGF